MALKIQPKKSLGQNYLTDENICRNIVESFSIAQTDDVLEIGPGQGAITKYLIEKTSNLTVVEFDRNNCAIISQKFPNLNLVMGDFLKFDLNSVGSKENKLRIIGNIPYNITTEIVFKLIDNRAVIKDAQLMMQEEVARRFAAEPDNKDYGIPSVFVQVFSKPKLLFKVSRNVFYPKPKVDSRVIQFDFSHSRESEIKDTVFFKKFVKAAFSMRRKTLKNSLAKLELDLTKADFDFTRRAETVTIDEFIELSNIFSNTNIN